MRTLCVWLIFLALICAVPAQAANTIVYGQNTIGITPDGSEDWDATTASANGYYVEWIIFKPSAANDVLCILDGSTGPALIYAASITGDNLVFYPQIRCKPYLDASACTFGTPASARITIGIRK